MLWTEKKFINNHYESMYGLASDLPVKRRDSSLLFLFVASMYLISPLKTEEKDYFS